MGLPRGQRSVGRADVAHRGRSRRGMVTAELAVGMLSVVTLVGVVSGMAAALQLHARCLDGASEIARQAARHDAAAVAAAQSDLPAGATISQTTQGNLVVVRVSAPVTIAGTTLVTVTAQAETLEEQS